jgi:hypothetical protein
MALRGSNAKIQTQALMGGEGTKSVTKEPRVLYRLKNVKARKFSRVVLRNYSFGPKNQTLLILK